MEPKYINETKLTADLYQKGIVKSYRKTHKILLAVSTAYALLMLYISYVFLLDFDFTICIPLFLFGICIILWNTLGYKFGTKKSFKKFAKLHGSHYQVDIDFRFYEDYLEQETTKTKLTLMYKDIDIVYNMNDILLIIYTKQVIIVDKNTFIDCTVDDVLEFMKNKNINVKVLC